MNQIPSNLNHLETGSYGAKRGSGHRPGRGGGHHTVRGAAGGTPQPDILKKKYIHQIYSTYQK